MDAPDFEFYKALLLKHSGLNLTAEKTYLLRTRLTPLCKTLGYETLEDFTKHLRGAPQKSDIAMVVEAMTTNETSFFRDGRPFQNLREHILPELIKKRAPHKRLRIWSAAASTGQEAYSIAIIVRETLDKMQMPDYPVEILATDIADNILRRAQAGSYNNFEIQRGLSMPLIVRYFKQDKDGWTVNDDLRRMVKFMSFNLLDSPARLGTFDIIFCRNVLIYFTPDKKLQVLRGLCDVMAADGLLFLGSCENAMHAETGLAPAGDHHGAYVKSQARNAAAPSAISATKPPSQANQL